MKRKTTEFKTGLLLMLCLLSLSSYANVEKDLDEDELVIVESVLDKNVPVRRSRPATIVESPSSLEFKNMNELSDLAPFDEISVIQKRFMPKSSRFELHGGVNLIMNNPFFNISGFQFKLGYFFMESLGLEATYRSLVTSDSQDVKDLKNMNLSTKNLSYVTSSTSYALNFSPIYGKISWFNHKIIPFDHFFTLGYAITQTQNENAGGLQIGTGQLFSWSKSMGFRWDLLWNSYVVTTSPGVSNSIQDLYVSCGVSFFFPEASYR